MSYSWGQQQCDFSENNSIENENYFIENTNAADNNVNVIIGEDESAAAGESAAREGMLAEVFKDKEVAPVDDQVNNQQEASPIDKQQEAALISNGTEEGGDHCNGEPGKTKLHQTRPSNFHGIWQIPLSAKFAHKIKL